MPPKEAKWTTTQIVLTGLLAGAVGAAAAVGAMLMLSSSGDEDDRPPIIVSNGSADFEADDNHPKYYDAQWETKVDKRQFKHVQTNGATVLGFLVDVQGNRKAVKCTLAGGDTRLLPPFFGTHVTVAYGVDDDTARPTATFEIDPDSKKELLLSLPEDADLEGGNKRAKVKDVGNQRKKIRWFEVGGTAGYRCTIQNPGQTKLIVRQLK